MAQSVEDMRPSAKRVLPGSRPGWQLTAEQEKSWPAFEQAAARFHQVAHDRRNAARQRAAVCRGQSCRADESPRHRDGGKPAMPLKKLSDATGPLYNGLMRVRSGALRCSAGSAGLRR